MGGILFLVVPAVNPVYLCAVAVFHLDAILDCGSGVAVSTSFGFSGRLVFRQSERLADLDEFGAVD